jgi:hypothetical protein
MTDPGLRGRRTTRWRALTLVAAAVVALAGCELATGTVRTATELEDAGIRNPNLQYDGGEARLEYDSGAGPLQLRAEQDRAAGIIWRNLPFRVDQITVTQRDGLAGARRSYPRPLLERQFGPRPAGLDRSPSQLARRAVLLATVVAALVLLAVVVIIVLVVRALRRRPPTQPAYGQQPWAQPGPPAQQPWGQPGPPPPPRQDREPGPAPPP